jgi:hypothetical protein
MAAVALGATVASSIMGAIGGMASGEAQSKAFQYQAGVAQVNAQIAKQNAAYELALGEQQAQAEGMKGRAKIGMTRAAQGAGGLDVNSGSNVDVRASEAELGAYDQAIIRNNAARRAYGQEVLATQAQAQAGLDTFAAKTSREAGNLDAFTSLLGGAGSFASKWTQFKSAGVDPGSLTF